MSYLDNAGLAHFWGKVKSALAGKQDALTPDESITLQGGGIGVALPTKSLSRAEYDALPEAEKQAEAVYLVDEPDWTPVPLSIQEYDTEDGWHVRKWSSGYVEMFLRFTQDGVFPEASWFSLYFQLFQTYAYPVKLTEKYSEAWSILGTSPSVRLFLINQGENSLEETSRFGCAVAGKLASPVSSEFSCSVTGRWK